jgi:hypothetical protein
MHLKRQSDWLLNSGVYIVHTLAATVVLPFLSLLVGWGFTSIIGGSELEGDFLAAGPPVYVAVGVVVGFFVNRVLRHRSSLWVWIPPLLLFVDIFQNDVASFGVHAALRDNFGFPPTGGIEAVIATCPLYSAIAYSLGSWVGLRRSRSRSARKPDSDNRSAVGNASVR